MSFDRLSRADSVAIREFMQVLDANQHLDLPDYKDLVRREVRKLTPTAKRFVAQAFVDEALEREGKTKGQG